MSQPFDVSVLLVDDNPANILAMSAALEGVGAEVVTALSGAEALTCLLRREFCAILMDVQMPVMDGFQTAEIIRKRARTRDVPIIFVTAISQADEHVARGYRLGAVDYLFKPVPADMLCSKVAAFVDLARKRALIEQQAIQLAASEARYRRLVEKTPVAVYSAELGAFGANRYMSPQIEGILGFVADAFVKDCELWVKRVHPEDREQVCSDFASAVSRRVPFSTEYRMLAADDRVVWVLDEAVVVDDAPDEPAHVQGIRQNVTERHLARQALEEANSVLRTTAEQLQAANGEIEFSNRELEMFNSAVAHDLRAPLRSIAGFSTTLLEDYSPLLDEEGQDLLTRIHSAAGWMDALINDLLHLSHCSHDAMRREPVNLSELAASCLAELAREAPERHVTTRITPGLITEGDSRLLRIALDNLLRNAWKFTSKTASPTIEVGENAETGAYFVRDDGAGFDMAYASALFGAFQRLHRQDEFEGNGIGLITVKRVMERHGGELSAYAELDKGATFSFTLPRTLPPS
ncbi:MAG: response regulator [Pseudomonadota bacterium]|nr:response regulator [Pseudomonadota bacterium]